MSLLIFFYKSYVTENQILRLKHPILNQNQLFLSFCDIDPFGGEYAKHFHSVDPLKCSEEEDWLSLSNGTIYIDTRIKKKTWRNIM
jgi:hypothetical protein